MIVHLTAMMSDDEIESNIIHMVMIEVICHMY